MPDVLGYRLERALSILNKYNFEIVVKETFGKNNIKTDHVRVIRQKKYEDKVVQLIIAYF